MPTVEIMRIAKEGNAKMVEYESDALNFKQLSAKNSSTESLNNLKTDFNFLFFFFIAS